MEYKEFSYDDLFELLPINNKLSKNNLSKDGTTPVLSSDTTNNGIVGYTTIEPNYIVDDAVPIYVVFGDHTRTLNITTENFCVMDNVKVLKPKTFNISQLLYICSVWKKAIPNLGYARHWSVAKKAKILLPITSSGEPNYAYMEQYMNDIEQEVINELKTQSNNLFEDLMKETGISSIELTEEGKELLNRKVEYGEFKVGELFYSENGDTDIKKEHINNKGIPVITSGFANNGVLGNSDVFAKAIKENTITIDMFGNCFYRDFSYKMVTHARVFALIPKHKELTKYCMLYISSLLSNYNQLYNYTNMCSFNKIQADSILLPITSLGLPDYVYMENYMKLQEKLLLRESNEFIEDFSNKLNEL